jgi:hypothetical protein
MVERCRTRILLVPKASVTTLFLLHERAPLTICPTTANTDDIEGNHTDAREAPGRRDSGEGRFCRAR